MIKEKKRNGYLLEVVNTLGKKPKIAVVQQIIPPPPKGKPWLARVYNKPYTKKMYGKTAEGLARKMAKLGYKSVVIMD